MNRRQLLHNSLLMLSCGVGTFAARSTLAEVLPRGMPSRDVFSGDTRRMVAVLAELIIPATDTPGATEAGVPQFIELMVTDWYDDAERRIFFDGLEALNAHCVGRYRKRFLECDSSQQTEALRQAEQVAGHYTYPPSFLGKDTFDEDAPFFIKLKELTVLGYYTSETGATQELAYNPMPMRYDGAYPLSKVGSHWSY